MARDKPDADDLAWASEWVESFDPGGDPEDTARRDRIVAWIDEHQKRAAAKDYNDELVNRIAEETGAPKSKIRASKTFKNAKR
jgi:hypothetical protein